MTKLMKRENVKAEKKLKKEMRRRTSVVKRPRDVAEHSKISVKIVFSRFPDFSTYLDVCSMSHMLINLILMILLFYRTLLSCLEAEISVKIDFT